MQFLSLKNVFKLELKMCKGKNIFKILQTTAEIYIIELKLKNNKTKLMLSLKNKKIKISQKLSFRMHIKLKNIHIF